MINMYFHTYFYMVYIYYYIIMLLYIYRTILEMAKRREKSKKELLKLTIEIFEKR